MLVLTMMIQSLHQLGVLAFYKLKKDVFVEAFCINKDKPDLCCQGKCFLEKQLGGESSQDQNKSLPTQTEFPYFIVTFNEIKGPVFSEDEMDFSDKILRTLAGIKSSLAHPPESGSLV
jgi:hypothetical protein